MHTQSMKHQPGSLDLCSAVSGIQCAVMHSNGRADGAHAAAACEARCELTAFHHDVLHHQSATHQAENVLLLHSERLHGRDGCCCQEICRPATCSLQGEHECACCRAFGWAMDSIVHPAAIVSQQSGPACSG